MCMGGCGGNKPQATPKKSTSRPTAKKPSLPKGWSGAFGTPKVKMSFGARGR